MKPLSHEADVQDKSGELFPQEALRNYDLKSPP
jgi:hypothetical protein